jgi:hypothetical protein
MCKMNDQVTVPKQIDQFTILGERNSGTHFLQYAMINNFNIQYNRNEKHFFGFTGPLKGDNVLTIFIVRNPIDWIDSFFKRAHHVPSQNKKTIEDFIRNEWYSVYEANVGNNKPGDEIMEDRDYLSKERYKNIFELRQKKNEYALHVIHQYAKHVYVLKYEDLRDHYEDTLDKICKQFGLVKKRSTYMKTDKYKGTYNALYEFKPILLSEEIKEEIRSKIDKKQEMELGYEL